ncbi:hypothetical protein HY449_03620 [Candidatus Pacearchaeota archaeon]|nr:hypothetical protein [Candidatus Pacearchaeota archaeon]
METEIKDVKRDLESLKKIVSEMRERMIDEDSIMTEEDYDALLAAREEKKRNELTSFDDLKKELKL